MENVPTWVSAITHRIPTSRKALENLPATQLNHEYYLHGDLEYRSTAETDYGGNSQRQLSFEVAQTRSPGNVELSGMRYRTFPHIGGRRDVSCRMAAQETPFPTMVQTRNKAQSDIRKGVRSRDSSLFGTDDLAGVCLMRDGTLYSDLPARLRRYRSDIFDDKYKRLPWYGLSRTITAHIGKDGYWYIHPKQHRTLTMREAARIQTFPDRFRFGERQVTRFVRSVRPFPLYLQRL